MENLRGLPIKYVTGEGQVFCDDSTKVSVLKCVTLRDGVGWDLKLFKIARFYQWMTPKNIVLF